MVAEKKELLVGAHDQEKYWKRRGKQKESEEHLYGAAFAAEVDVFDAANVRVVRSKHVKLEEAAADKEVVIIQMDQIVLFLVIQ